ncbi:type IV secretion system protein B4 [uncultured Tateyamaria sp.]|nr:type IV secretion system protein B4 [uncultured Tateyamaria sp.]
MDKVERKHWAVDDKLRRVLPPYAPFFKHLPYLWEYDDHTIRCRDHELMVSLEIEGIDANTATTRTIEALTSEFANVLKGLDERWTFYIHRLTRSVNIKTKPVKGDSFQAAIDRKWTSHIQSDVPRNTMLVLTVLRGRDEPLRLPLLRKFANKLIADDVKERKRNLDDLVSVLETALNGVKLRKLAISDGSLLGFLGAVNTGFYQPIPRQTLSLVAEDVSSVSARFWPDVIEVFEGFEETRWATVLYVQTYPTATVPAMLDALDGMMDVIVTQSYTPIAQRKISERAQRRIDQMLAAEDVASTAMQDLKDAADDLESNLLGFGTHHMSITILADTKEELARKASRVIGIGQQAGMVLAKDKFALEAMFFAAHPGNMKYRARRSTISAINFADMATFHSEHKGHDQILPWRQPVTTLPTIGGNTYDFSFHPPVKSVHSEPSNGHTLIMGPSDSGKTTTAMFLVIQAMRVCKRVILFDALEAMRMPIAAGGGQYASIRAGIPTGLNPLMTETDERGQAWLLTWFSSLLEQTGQKLTPWQSQTLKEAIRQNCDTSKDLRNFAHFQDLIGDSNDGGDLSARVAEWAPGGRYGWVFDTSEKPLVDLTANSLTAIDMTEILKLDTERTALLAYLFRIIERMAEDKVPTFLGIDEASKGLNDEYFAAHMSDWLVTVRKLQVVVALMTQFPSQIKASKAKTILEALPNRLLFPNSEAEAKDYDGFGFNAAEISYLLGGQYPGMRTALWRKGPTSTVLNVDIGALGPLLTALGGGGAGEARFGHDFADRPDFWKEDTTNA